MKNIPGLTFRLLIVSWITAKRQLIHDRTASRDQWDSSYDFIVVGAGSAGCVVASRLAENPRVKVLLINKGGPQSAIWNDVPTLYVYANRLLDNTLSIEYYNEPQIRVGKQFLNGMIGETLGITLGGSSAISSMVYNRGNRRDYDRWAQDFGAKGWDYRSILPFFKLSENNTDPELVKKYPGYHGTNGPMEVSSFKVVPKIFELIKNVLNELGYQDTDFNGPKQLGVGYFQQTINSRGFRVSNANAYVDPNPYPENLHIVARALVSKVLFNGVTAVGVEFARNDTPFRVYARKEVILTAGAFNSPQILMLSGVGINNDLQRLGIPVIMDLPVGNYYKNHGILALVPTITDPEYTWPAPVLSIRYLSQLYFNSSGRLSIDPFFGLYFNTKNNHPKDWPNMLLEVLFNMNGISISTYGVRTRSVGSIRLQSRSPYIQPAIDPNFLADPQDLEELVEGVKFMFKLFETTDIASKVQLPTFESFNCSSCGTQYMYECDDGIRCLINVTIVSSTQFCCSNRMGDVNRDDVVVDPQLRVKNINNIRVCDASIFPDLPNSNTNAPVTMVAEKCAQLIKDTYNI